ncbi:hypothetical protein LFM09_29065 [Lentzea alba]|uniref:hypothetical protein n=1 Tax=Lentzea alba TaxID=2714351 RepID=UPI0039BF62EA
MIRKTTAAALVLSAVPAALALTLFAGTAQAEDTPWGRSISSDTSWSASIANDDTPWPQRINSDDTPWGREITAIPLIDTPWDDKHDTPWG